VIRRAATALLLALSATGAVAGGGDYATLPGGSFRSALDYEDVAGRVAVAPFAMMKRPVTNGEFLAFVQAHPQWRRDRVATTLAEPRYLSHWAGPTTLGPATGAAQPVVQVSWFAAAAYCEAQGARLPSWHDW
jgi:formylglycine-generating enzyme required for sulfatase activity